MCIEVCPVKIPIPEIINRLRFEGVRQDKSTIKDSGSRRKVLEALIWKGWSFTHKHPFIYRSGTKIATRLRKLIPKKLGAWTRVRKAPALAPKTLHELMKQHSGDNK